MPIYKNGNYIVTILNDGTKIRQTKDDEFIPVFAENCDVKITDKCSQSCPFCYEGCTKSGKHPDLIKFLEFLKKKKVFANITVNQSQFINNFELIKQLSSNKLVYGVGVSLQHANEELISYMSEIPNTVLHTINGILTKEDIKSLSNHDLKILILGYKELQRGISYQNSHLDVINTNKKYVYDNLKDILSKFKVVSFDNLAIEQLDVKRVVNEKDWDEFYMGDDGGFTFYIDMVKGEFSKNSIAKDRYPIGDKTVDEMFQFIKSIS